MRYKCSFKATMPGTLLAWLSRISCLSDSSLISSLIPSIASKFARISLLSPPNNSFDPRNESPSFSFRFWRWVLRTLKSFERPIPNRVRSGLSGRERKANTFPALLLFYMFLFAREAVAATWGGEVSGLSVYLAAFSILVSSVFVCWIEPWLWLLSRMTIFLSWSSSTLDEANKSFWILAFYRCSSARILFLAS